MPIWTLHGDGRTVEPGAVVKPNERLSWPGTIAIGAQHVVAMFGATFLVPILTGFPVSTTLFFSGVGTILFLLIATGPEPIVAAIRKQRLRAEPATDWKSLAALVPQRGIVMLAAATNALVELPFAIDRTLSRNDTALSLEPAADETLRPLAPQPARPATSSTDATATPARTAVDPRCARVTVKRSSAAGGPTTRSCRGSRRSRRPRRPCAPAGAAPSSWPRARRRGRP